mmetsp:Transcript_29215/g.61434  ORF Transcript_29215/g.61434 Transcript_29215/m.61434 type:complete len:298 (-) Transcript_29215:159-1052(-)
MTDWDSSIPMHELQLLCAKQEAKTADDLMADLKLLVAILESHGNEEVVSTAIDKLSEIACIPDNVPLLYEAGTIPLLMQLARHGSNEVNTKALAMLLTLSTDETCHAYIDKLWRIMNFPDLDKQLPMQHFDNFHFPSTAVPAVSSPLPAIDINGGMHFSCLHVDLSQQSSPLSDICTTPTLSPGTEDLRRRRWSHAEDLTLRHAVLHLGAHRWPLVAKALTGRTGKQCRERWHNHLKNGLSKGAWSDSEKDRLELLFKVHGPKWSLIAKHLPGRTDNSIKNFWHATYKRSAPATPDK